jgi:hypothetical protein
MPGQYRTQADLIVAVLGRLGVLAAGQPVDAEDVTNVSTELDGIFRKLSALEIVTIQDPLNIPGVYFVDLADIIAGEVCTKFGAKAEDYVMLLKKGLGGVEGIDVGSGAAAKSLRQITRGRPTYETLRTHYM